MLKSYLKVALRNLRKSAFFSLINLVGLTLSLVVSVSIYLYVQSESYYDSYHPEGSNLYRLALDRIYPGHVIQYAVTPPSMGEAIFDELPEVIDHTRVWRPLEDVTIDFNEEDRVESEFLMANANFFEHFGIELIAGDPGTALANGNSMVLTQEAARRYFGEEDPMGKELQTSVGDFVIAGVVEAVPENTHFTFDFLANLTLQRFFQNPNYVNFASHNYVKLREGTDPEAVEERIPEVVKKYASGPIQRITGISYDEYVEAGNGYHYYLQEVASIHLHSQLQNELGVNGNITYIYILISVGIFVFVLAIVNFVNLSTARSFDRAKEVGVRKVLGSSKKRLIFQFLTESILLSIMSHVLALLIVLALISAINNSFDVSLTHLSLLRISSLLLFLGSALLTGVFAGLYPAFALSSFKTVTVLKGKFRSNKKAIRLRHGLIVFQFWISTILIGSTFIVREQLNFMQNTPLGFDKEGMLIIERADLLEDAEVFKEAVLGRSDIVEVGGASELPGGSLYFGGLFKVSGADETIAINCILADDDFIETMGINVVSGRAFANQFNDSLNIMFNQAAVAALQLSDDPVGQLVRNIIPQNTANSRDFTVTGIVEDYHFKSLHSEITPLAILSMESVTADNNFYPMQPVNALSVKVRMEHLNETISGIEEVWSQFVPRTAMSYHFLDDQLDNLYQSELKLSRFFTTFSSLAIVIAVIGLFGLSAFVSRLRIKEIGVRKVLGSSVVSIVILFQKYFGKLILISILLAIPTIILLMNQWLEGFAYRISIGVGMLVIASLMSFLITALTVLMQSYRAATSNPVITLKSE